MIALSQLAWVYLLIALAAILMLTSGGFIWAARSALYPYSLRRTWWAWAFAMMSTLPLCVAGEIMWEALDWVR